MPKGETKKVGNHNTTLPREEVLERILSILKEELSWKQGQKHFSCQS